jgi:hypothetical protein
MSSAAGDWIGSVTVTVDICSSAYKRHDDADITCLLAKRCAVGKLEIIFPAGAGFDENAMDAVSHWKYQPFMLTITVNYAFSR